MIQANELRLGNYIASSGNKENIETWVIGKVHSISELLTDFEQIQVETDEDFTWFFKDSYFGIPLTEEWILKFNVLKKQNGYPYKFLNGYIKIRKSVYFFKYYGLDIEIKYVHQLQNFYFALTQKELTL